MSALAKTEKRASLLSTMAGKYGVEPEKMLTTLKATAFKGDVSNEQMMALLVVANQYELNPWTKEIYAFPDKKNGIVPVVGLDGWSRIINSHPQFDGMEFVESESIVESAEHKPCPEWIECRIYRKDRSRPIAVRERFSECYRPPFKSDKGYVSNGPWQSHTSRFLRHKAMIQCSRLAFGFVGIYDPDEADRLREAIDVTPMRSTAAPARDAKSALDGLAAVQSGKPEPQTEAAPAASEFEGAFDEGTNGDSSNPTG